MQFVYWFAGVCITYGLCKLVFESCRKIFTKDNIDHMFKLANSGMQKTAHNISESMKQRKKKKEEEKANKAIVTIR